MREIDLVLTSCIFPNSLEINPELSINERIRDTNENIENILSQTESFSKKINIYFIDCSLSEVNKSYLDQVIEKRFLNRIKIIEFSLSEIEKSIILSKGKGYSEMLMIKKFLTISNSNFFIKISGRYLIKNLKKIIYKFSVLTTIDIYLDYSKIMGKCSTFFFISNKKLFLKYFFNEIDKLNDNKKYYLEYYFLDIIKKNKLKTKKLSPKPNLKSNLKSGSHHSKYNFFKNELIKLIYYVP